MNDVIGNAATSSSHLFSASTIRLEVRWQETIFVWIGWIGHGNPRPFPPSDTEHLALTVSMKDFVLQQQCPSAEVALKRAEASILQFERSLEQGSDDTTCHCPHLLEYLPEQLDLTFAKSETRGRMLRNPIHAMHLASQLDPVWLQSLEDPPVLYGEEQEKLEAITKEGISETWHPWMRRTVEDESIQEQQLRETTTAPKQDTQIPMVSDETVQSTQPPSPEPASVPSASISQVEPPLTATADSTLSEDRFMAMYAQEEHIYKVQDSLLGRRTVSASSLVGTGVNKKRKETFSTTTAAGATSDTGQSSSFSAAGAGQAFTAANGAAAPTAPKKGTSSMTDRPWARPIVHFTRADEQAWEYKLKVAQDKVTMWLEQYKHARRSFYAEGGCHKIGTRGMTRLKPFFGSDSADSGQAACQSCQTNSSGYCGDDLMQCLECSFVGCYVTENDDEEVISEHMMEHLVVKNHNFGTPRTLVLWNVPFCEQGPLTVYLYRLL